MESLTNKINYSTVENDFLVLYARFKIHCLTKAVPNKIISKVDILGFAFKEKATIEFKELIELYAELQDLTKNIKLV